MSDKRIMWKPQVWPIDKLRPYSKNPRIITETGLKQLKSSFDEIGMAQMININTDGTILSGHARFQQLKSEGVVEFDVMVPDRTLTPKEEEAVVIRMNKNTAGIWDFSILANDFDIDELMDWGFKDFELIGNNIIEKVNSSDENDEWVGMPEFEIKGKPYRLIIHFETEFYRNEFVEEKKLEITKKAEKVWSTTWPFQAREDLASVKYE